MSVFHVFGSVTGVKFVVFFAVRNCGNSLLLKIQYYGNVLVFRVWTVHTMSKSLYGVILMLDGQMSVKLVPVSPTSYN